MTHQPPSLADLRSMVDYLRGLADEASAFVRRAVTAEARMFARGQATAFSNSAIALERLIAPAVVSEGLSSSIRVLEQPRKKVEQEP